MNIKLGKNWWIILFSIVLFSVIFLVPSIVLALSCPCNPVLGYCTDPITSCGCSLDSTAVYTLANDISTTSGTCLTITAQNTVLNCNSFTISGNGGGNGVELRNDFNVVKYCNITNFNYGIYAIGEKQIYAIIYNNIYGNGKGILLLGIGGSNNHIIHDNKIFDNSVYGVLISNSNGNSIYNNFFNNTYNAKDGSSTNYWNTSETSGTNIIGGPNKGGNYWNDYTGIDTDHDGIGDTILPYNSSGLIRNGGDYLPLVDINPPKWSDNKTNPKSPAVYSSLATYQFNITWTDNVAVDKVILEMDGINYTIPKGTGDIYSMIFSTCSGGGGGGGGRPPVLCSMDPITPWIEFFKFLLTGGVVRAADTPCLGVGTHYYKWYANDTSNNWNSTRLLSFTIYKYDPVYIDIISPENKTYTSTSVDIKYTVSSPFDISWIGYSLNSQPNVTLTGNTTINVAEKTHNIIFYANTTYGIMNSSDIIYFTVSLPKTTTTTTTTTSTTSRITTSTTSTRATVSCTCTAWKPTYICCSTGKGTWTRTCTPKACQAESKCEGACIV